MTDVQNTPNAPADTEQAIAALKRQADRLGISYKSNVSIATLQKAVKDKMEGNEAADQQASEGSNQVSENKAVQSKADEHEALFNEAMKLVRVIITPLEATKAANLESENFTAGNSVIPTITRNIPFGVEWHVEQIILNTIRERKYQLFVTKKNALGHPQVSAKYVPAYSISVLDPLSEEELKELADQQARTRSLEDE